MKRLILALAQLVMALLIVAMGMLLTLIIVLLTVEVIAMLEFTNGEGASIPKFSLDRIVLLAFAIVAMIPAYRFWRWYWRWPTYVGLAIIALVIAKWL